LGWTSVCWPPLIRTRSTHVLLHTDVRFSSQATVGIASTRSLTLLCCLGTRQLQAFEAMPPVYARFCPPRSPTLTRTLLPNIRVVFCTATTAAVKFLSCFSFPREQLVQSTPPPYQPEGTGSPVPVATPLARENREQATYRAGLRVFRRPLSDGAGCPRV